MVDTKNFESINKHKFRFWDKVNINEENDCWNWTRQLDNYSYGRFQYNGSSELAHRVAYLLWYEELPEGLLVLHKCDNPPCVNPSHLFLGTDNDNNKDMAAKGRNPLYCLKDDDIIEILRLCNETTETFESIGKQFNVTHTMVMSIYNNKVWKHIPRKIYDKNARKIAEEAKPVIHALIKEFYETGLYTQRELGFKFNYSQKYISLVVNGKI